MNHVADASWISGFLSPYLRAKWHDSHSPDGMSFRSAQIGTRLCASIVANRHPQHWSVYGWTHAPDPAEDGGCLLLKVELRFDGEHEYSARATRTLFETLLTRVLRDEIPAGHDWWRQIDRIGIEDLDGLKSAWSREVHMGLRSVRLPDILAEIDDARHLAQVH